MGDLAHQVPAVVQLPAHFVAPLDEPPARDAPLHLDLDLRHAPVPTRAAVRLAPILLRSPVSLALFLGGYAIMFTGHFVFERNVPTILKHPTTPFVMAWAVVRGLLEGAARWVAPGRGR